jgi:hypothetical protein
LSGVFQWRGTLVQVWSISSRTSKMASVRADTILAYGHNLLGHKGSFY